MIFLLLIFMVLLNRIPIAGKILKGVSTMFHEFGHAIVAVLTGGRVKNIQLFSDNRGLANVEVYKGIPSVLMPLAGYPVETGAAFAMLWLYANEFYELLIFVIAVVALFTLRYICNSYGYVWLLLLGVYLTFAFINREEAWVGYSLLVIVLSTIGEALYASFVIFVLSVRDRKKAGDATNLAEKTHIPAIIWGMMFLLFALFVFYHSLELLELIAEKNPL